MEYDVIVLGVGSAGLTVSLTAARLGFRVAVVEKHQIGGDCLNHGCIPSKTFIKSAKVMHQIRNAQKWGVQAQAKPFNMAKAVKHLTAQQDIIRDHENPKFLKELGIDVYEGSPQFLDAHQIKVNNKTLYGKYIVISTGASPFRPPFEGDGKYLTNEEIFSLKILPKSLVVVGGGPIGCEMAQTFARFGSKVTLLQGAESIMNREDPELAKRLTNVFEHEGIKIIANARTKEVRKRARQKVVVFEHQGKEKGVIGDEVLVAIGRRPNVQGLDLEKAGITFSPKGIPTNKRLQTNVKHIYACGDVRGSYQFSHTAGYEGGIIIANMLFKARRKVNYEVIPWVTFTDPELARAGLTEQEAQEKGIKYTLLTQEYKELDRAITENEREGMIKLLVDKKGYILGCHILGPHAGETLHEVYLAMTQKIKIKALTQMIHAYPTLADIVKKAAGEYYKPKLYSDKTKRFLKFLNRFF